jgi:hypothetical protein
MAQFGGGKLSNSNRRSAQMQSLSSTMNIMGFEQVAPNKKSKVGKTKRVSVKVPSDIAEFLRLNPNLKNAKDLIKALK